MREVDLTGTNCTQAVFAGVDLSGAQLHGARFTKADLRGSNLSAFDPFHAELTGALIDPQQAIVVAQATGWRSADRGDPNSRRTVAFPRESCERVPV